MTGGETHFVMPPGYRCDFLETVDSTNAEARRRAQHGEAAGLWIWAGSQSQGRGRTGRDWTSVEGNLYASVLLRPQCGLTSAVGLSLLAGVAAFEAVAQEIPDSGTRASLRLKWPNDLMIGQAKLGGILLESFPDSAGAPTIIIGTGVNIAQAPDSLGRPATSLRQHGVETSPPRLLSALAHTTAMWLDIWADGRGFAQIRQAWLKRAGDIGAPISVKLQSEEVEGQYAGIDASGALLLHVPGQGERRITVGDVFLRSGDPANNNEQVANGKLR